MLHGSVQENQENGVDSVEIEIQVVKLFTFYNYFDSSLWHDWYFRLRLVNFSRLFEIQS